MTFYTESRMQWSVNHLTIAFFPDKGTLHYIRFYSESQYFQNQIAINQSISNIFKVYLNKQEILWLSTYNAYPY